MTPAMFAWCIARRCFGESRQASAYGLGVRALMCIAKAGSDIGLMLRRLPTDEKADRG